jgi:FAD/FMN-containing dehydrogenase
MTASDRPHDAAPFLAALARALPADRVRRDDASLAAYGSDWTKLPAAPAAVVLPASRDEVVTVVRLAAEHGQPLVPAGGRTGLAGGAVASAGSVVVALDRMARILDLDPVGRLLRVEAGAVTAAVQAHAAAHDLFFPMSFASAGSSTIGGNVATNAGGVRVVRWGMFRDHVAGLDVVTGNGDLLELGRGLVKDATGLDLMRLFLGSEGTLGIVVGATLRLASPPRPRATAMLALPRLTDLDRVFLAIRGAFVLEAFELVSARSLQAVIAHTGASLPFSTPRLATTRAAATLAPTLDRSDSDPALPAYALLVEVECLDDATWDRFLAVLGDLADAEVIGDAVPTRDAADTRRLWDLRERAAESLEPLGPRKYDLSVRVAQVAAFLPALERLLAGSFPGVDAAWYGHVGDGNLHLNVLPPTASREHALYLARLGDLDASVYDLVSRFGGSVAAEHGVGLLKRGWIGKSRSAAELAAMRGIKLVFDPRGIMNPGKSYS